MESEPYRWAIYYLDDALYGSEKLDELAHDIDFPQHHT